MISDAHNVRSLLGRILRFTTTDIGADWTRIRHAFSIPPGITSIQTHLGRAAGDGIDWDDISVKQV